MLSRKSIETLCVMLALAVCARADVWKVPGDVPELQLALDLARAGDTVLVEPGEYAEPLELVGKGLSLVADGGVVSIPEFLLRDLPSDETFIMSGFVCTAQGPFAEQTSGFVARDAAGLIRVSDSQFVGRVGTPDGRDGGVVARNGTPGALLMNCDSVSFAGCVFLGGDGASLVQQRMFSKPTAGGAGMAASESRVVLDDCALTGGSGGSVRQGARSFAGDGGSGLLAWLGSQVDARRSRLAGGRGGSISCASDFRGACGVAGAGGDGATLFDMLTELRGSGLELVPGSGGFSGVGSGQASGGEQILIDEFADWQLSLERELTLDFQTPVREAEELELRISGEPATEIFLFASLEGAYLSSLNASGVFQLGAPFVIHGVSLGEIPESGLLWAPQRVAQLPLGFDALAVHVQVVEFIDGVLFTGPARVVTLLDEDF